VQLRETEVGELRIATLGDKNIVRLDVAVQDAGRVRSGQSIGNADEHVDDLFPGSRLVMHPVLQRTAIDELGHQVLSAVDLTAFEDGEDMRMIERRGGQRLLLKARDGE